MLNSTGNFWHVVNVAGSGKFAGRGRQYWVTDSAGTRPT